MVQVSFSIELLTFAPKRLISAQLEDTVKNQPPTIEDVARAAGVSTASISRALNDPDKVAKATREKIDKVIEALGYTPHFGARAMASSRIATVGAVIPTLANAMFASGLQAFQEVLAEEGVMLLVATTGYDPDAELRQIRSLMGQGATGLMLIGDERPQATRDFLEKRSVPHVIGWATSDRHPVAGFDNRAAARMIARHVIAQGHRRIAMISGILEGNDRVAERIAGVKEAIDEVADATLTHVAESRYLIEHAGAAFDQVWADRPTCIIGGSDVLAAGAIVRAREQGVSVPDEVSITGFDDIGLSLVSSPPLTTVRVPQIEMGRAAAKNLLAQLAGERPENTVLETEVITRASLAPPRD